MIITNLKQAVKNPNRVNIFVDGKYEFSLDMTQVVDFGVKVGREITDGELAELKKASEFGKLYQRALEWVLMRPRSEKELNDYLRKKIYEKKLNEEFKNSVYERLKKKGYVNDLRFAEWYVENRFIKKGVSKTRLRIELTKKGISREIIDEMLSVRDDEEEIKKIIARKSVKYNDEKLALYLARQGFSYDLIRRMVGKDES